MVARACRSELSRSHHRDVRRNASPICPDFRGELKVPYLPVFFSGRESRTRTDGHPRDFPCVSAVHAALFLTRNFPGDFCGDTSRVSHRRNICRLVSRRATSCLSPLHRLLILRNPAAPFSPRGTAIHRSRRLAQRRRVLEQTSVASDSHTTVVIMTTVVGFAGVSSVYPRTIHRSSISMCSPFPAGARGSRKTHEEID